MPNSAGRIYPSLDKGLFEANTSNRRQARENACVQVTRGLGLASALGSQSGTSFSSQSQSAVSQNQNKRKLL